MGLSLNYGAFANDHNTIDQAPAYRRANRTAARHTWQIRQLVDSQALTARNLETNAAHDSRLLVRLARDRGQSLYASHRRHFVAARFIAGDDRALGAAGG